MLTLASNSPCRRYLPALLGISFTVCSVVVDEIPLPDEHPAVYKVLNAEYRAPTSDYHLLTDDN